MYNRGWSGVNIDLDKKNIDLFNIARPNDKNLNYAVSNEIGKADLFFYHDTSPINTLNKRVCSDGVIVIGDDDPARAARAARAVAVEHLHNLARL